MIHLGAKDLGSFALELFKKPVSVRSQAGLEGALARPRQVSSFGEMSLFVVASHYADGIVRSHPFIDSNKRMAWGATAMFLAVNGYAIPPSSNYDIVRLVVGLAEGVFTREYFAGFLDAASSRCDGVVGT